MDIFFSQSEQECTKYKVYAEDNRKLVKFVFRISQTISICELPMIFTTQ